MDDQQLRLDGNAAAGLLQEVFVHELTVARGACASCGAVGEMGARNAGHLAAQIIALSDDAVALSLTEHRAKMRETARPPEGFVP